MPTNKPTFEALNQLSYLIKKLNTKPQQEMIDEIKAWGRLLRRHAGQQKRQKGKWGKDVYVYDKKSKKILRLKNDVVTAKY